MAGDLLLPMAMGCAVLLMGGLVVPGAAGGLVKVFLGHVSVPSTRWKPEPAAARHQCITVSITRYLQLHQIA